MEVLRRSKGEMFEIPGCALVRVAKIESGKIRIDVTAPFCPQILVPLSSPNEVDVPLNLDPEKWIVVRVLDVAHTDASGLRTHIGIETPSHLNCTRYEVVKQTVDRSEQFPWRRYQPRGRYWRQIGELIYIKAPNN